MNMKGHAFKIFAACSFLVGVFFCHSVKAADSEKLIVRYDDKVIVFHLAELKEKFKTRKMIVSANPAYKNRQMEYEGFDLQEFVAAVAPDKKSPSLTVVCLDGFQTTLSSEIFTMNRKALLAFQQVSSKKEDLISADEKWSLVSLKGELVSPGPYYIVWNSPQGTYPMGWPFQIKEIHVGGTYEPYPTPKK